MFCKYCGNSVSDNARFCGKCGADLGEGYDQKAAPAPAPAPAAAAPEAPAAEADDISPEEAAAKRKYISKYTQDLRIGYFFIVCSIIFLI